MKKASYIRYGGEHKTKNEVSKHKVQAILVNARKAFDSVSHGILLTKLSLLGFAVHSCSSCKIFCMPDASWFHLG